MPSRNAVARVADPVSVAVLAALFPGIVVAVVVACFAVVPLVVAVVESILAVVLQVVLIEKVDAWMMNLCCSV